MQGASDTLGLGGEGGAAGSDAAGASYLDAFAAFRDEVSLAIAARMQFAACVTQVLMAQLSASRLLEGTLASSTCCAGVLDTKHFIMIDPISQGCWHRAGCVCVCMRACQTMCHWLHDEPQHCGNQALSRPLAKTYTKM